ncbi:MAG TPA: glycosyltransferase [Tepidisphaeraceae bacterium]|jgi:processive 1,2-diacylglycerol beta-glucosyltransferase|nr:glycosyltransferase [Tepidisphaeraceae bacterium]
MSPRILICSASVGSGHGRAAVALQAALNRLRPDAFVQHVDVLSLTNAIFRRVYSKGYFDAIDLAPHVVRYVYDRLDRPRSTGIAAPQFFRSASAQLNFSRFIDLLTGGNWDLVVSTHFLPPEIIAALRSAGRVSFPHAVVTTDFDVHRLWVHSPVEKYFTATEEGRANLAGAGIAAENIITSGIPIDPVFGETKSREVCRARHGIIGGRPVVLQLSGGAGFGPAEKVHRALLDTPVPLEIVMVAGRNAAVREKIAAIPCPALHRRTVLGFTDRMDELMAVADVIVTKPGGLTTSEALARGAAMLVIEPIPGQEERNSDYLLENGAAVKVNNLASLPHKLSHLLQDRGRLQAMRDASRRLGKPFAAFDIARSVLKLIEPEMPRSIPPAPKRTSRFSRLRLRRWRRTRNSSTVS